MPLTNGNPGLVEVRSDEIDHFLSFGGHHYSRHNDIGLLQEKHPNYVWGFES